MSKTKQTGQARIAPSIQFITADKPGISTPIDLGWQLGGVAHRARSPRASVQR